MFKTILNLVDKIHFNSGIKIRADEFPKKPAYALNLKARIFALENELKKQKKDAGLGYLITYPHTIVVDIWQKLLPYNPNNIGNWSILELPQNQLFSSRTFEREVIFKMIDLYHGDKKKLEGYITSGGTEANIFSSWTGRKYLEKKGIDKEKICLINTTLTHYSIKKAADVIGVKDFTVGLNEKSWGMDVDSLKKTIKKLYIKGFRGFLLPLTIGYTLTGTLDPYKDICLRVRELKEKIKGIEFFVWVDAALNGLIEPFLNKKFRPFDLPEIQTFLVDFHKFGSVPCPAGVVLYRNDLRKLIEKPIDYLNVKDNTLLGSRSGIASVACWITIQSFGKRGFKKIIAKNKKKMSKFVKKYKNKNGLEFIISRNSLSCGIIVKNRKFNYKKLKEKHGLEFKRVKIKFKDKVKNLLISKAFFLKND